MLTDLRTMGIAELLAELDVGVAELDRIAEGLYPDALLTASIEDQVRVLAGRFQPAAAVTVHGNSDRLRDSVRILAHFFCAECLTNAARYASGAATAIDLEFSESELRIRVTDEGPGGAAQRPGGGLEGLSDRLQTAGGRLSLLSPIGGPTVVTAALPLS
jgi:signal transduction histidine kinase